MKAIQLTILCLALASTLAGYPYAEEDNIINLGEPTFGIATDEFFDGLFVYFYEPFCTPCREMWDALKTTAANLKNAGSRARIAKVECHDEVKLCDARGVSSFPSLLLHRTGLDTVEYRGLRNSETMTKWLQTVVDFKFPSLTSAELFKNFHLALVIKTPGNQINQAYKSLLDQVEVSLSDKLGDVDSKIGGGSAVLISSNGEVKQISNGAEPNTIVDDAHSILNGKAIPNFNHAVSVGLQSTPSGEYLFFFRTSKYDPNSGINKAFEAFKALDKVKPYFVNVHGDILGATLGRMFGVGENDECTIGILNKTGNIHEKYILDSKEASEDTIRGFIDNYKGRKLNRHYISAPLPNYEVSTKSPMRRYVQEIVGTQYLELGQTGNKQLFDKYVFVHFYFPWCEWCVKLEPTWNSLAYRMRHHSNVVIGKTDVSENDVPGFEMSEFPVLILFKPTTEKATDSDYKVYYGRRDISSLLNLLFEEVPQLKDSYEL